MTGICWIEIICIMTPAIASADAFEFRGEFTGWAGLTDPDTHLENNYGVRYIPQLIFHQALSDDSFWDVEASLNAHLSRTEDESNPAEVDLYRAIVRYATPRTETRIGLQQISFGSAQILRPLRWFDRLHPTDPLNFTEGVNAVRFRYDALNNAGVWLWGLCCNEDTKGYEHQPTAEGLPELGGRFQHPVPLGEVAVSLHTRSVEGYGSDEADFTENRIGIDGKWDVGIGLWIESACIQQKPSDKNQTSMNMTTAGADYTFGFGNGLYFSVEHMSIVLAEDLLAPDEDVQVSAHLFSYPVSLMDNLTFIGYYVWEQNAYLPHLNWGRTFDTTMVNISLFHVPDVDMISTELLPGETIAGTGLQFMLTINH
jgi:hypothetical protein